MAPSNTEATDTTHDRLLTRMSSLLPGQLEELLLRANIPPHYLPAHTASPMERVVAAIRYVESNGQLDQVARLLETVPERHNTSAGPIRARLVLLIVCAAGMTAAAFAGWPLHMSLFPTFRKHSASLLVVPDAEAAAMIAPQMSPFTLHVAGRSVSLPSEGVLIGTTHAVTGSLRAAYRSYVVDGEPFVLSVEYTDDIAASVAVRYNGKPCRAHPPAASEDTLWLVRFDDCN